MPNIQNLTITPRGQGNGRVFDIDGVVTNDRGDVVFDFSGGRKYTFPAILSTLTDEQQLEAMRLVVIYIIQVKAGLRNRRV